MKKENPKLQYRVNEQIHAREVRIVGDGIESTVLPTFKAIQMAEQKGVDFVSDRRLMNMITISSLSMLKVSSLMETK